MNMNQPTQTVTIHETTTITLPVYGSHLDISGIKDAVKRAGSHFFDADAMRFFGSRVDSATYAGPDGWYFVTSEKRPHSDDARGYTVRRLSVRTDEKGAQRLSIDELEGFQFYPTIGRARTAARKAAGQPVLYCLACSYRLTMGSKCAECVARAERQDAQAKAVQS